MNENTNLANLLDQLRKPFHPSQVIWKPGAVKGDRALALAYADLRAYMNRLADVCGGDWSVSYELWGDTRIICRLTIAGVTRSSTGESSSESERSEIGGTVAEAQAFKRACAKFGLGRYLYNLPTGWADYDPGKRQFTEKAKAKLTAMLVQHYRRASEDKSELAAHEVGRHDHVFAASADGDGQSELEAFNAAGLALYGADLWPAQSAKWVLWASDNRTSDASELSAQEIESAIASLQKRKEKARAQVNGNA